MKICLSNQRGSSGKLGPTLPVAQAPHIQHQLVGARTKQCAERKGEPGDLGSQQHPTWPLAPLNTPRPLQHVWWEQPRCPAPPGMPHPHQTQVLQFQLCLCWVSLIACTGFSKPVKVQLKLVQEHPHQGSGNNSILLYARESFL